MGVVQGSRFTGQDVVWLFRASFLPECGEDQRIMDLGFWASGRQIDYGKNMWEAKNASRH